MATATATHTTVRPAESEWIPSPLYRISVEQFEAMVACDIFTKGDKVHLINGYLVGRMTQKPPHVIADDLLGAELARVFPADRYYIRGAKPLRLPSRASEPEPDRCVARGTIRDYENRQPGPDDIVLLAEVADSSLADDRKLASEVYGPARICIYWIVNLVHRQVEVYTNPGPEGYQSRAVYLEGQAIPVVIDGQPLGQIAVVDILPTRPAGSNAEGNGA